MARLPPLGEAEPCTHSVSSAPQGLRFSGVNDTDFRVYLLGNPVSALHAVVGALSMPAGRCCLLSPARAHLPAGGLVAEPAEPRPLHPLSERLCCGHAEGRASAC